MRNFSSDTVQITRKKMEFMTFSLCAKGGKRRKKSTRGVWRRVIKEHTNLCLGLELMRIPNSNFWSFSMSTM